VRAIRGVDDALWVILRAIKGGDYPSADEIRTFRVLCRDILLRRCGLAIEAEGLSRADLREWIADELGERRVSVAGPWVQLSRLQNNQDARRTSAHLSEIVAVGEGEATAYTELEVVDALRSVSRQQSAGRRRRPTDVRQAEVDESILVDELAIERPRVVLRTAGASLHEEAYNASTSRLSPVQNG